MFKDILRFSRIECRRNHLFASINLNFFVQRSCIRIEFYSILICPNRIEVHIPVYCVREGYNTATFGCCPALERIPIAICTAIGRIICRCLDSIARKYRIIAINVPLIVECNCTGLRVRHHDLILNPANGDLHPFRAREGLQGAHDPLAIDLISGKKRAIAHHNILHCAGQADGVQDLGQGHGLVAGQDVFDIVIGKFNLVVGEAPGLGGGRAAGLHHVQGLGGHFAGSLILGDVIDLGRQVAVGNLAHTEGHVHLFAVSGLDFIALDIDNLDIKGVGGCNVLVLIALLLYRGIHLCLGSGGNGLDGQDRALRENAFIGLHRHAHAVNNFILTESGIRNGRLFFGLLLLNELFDMFLGGLFLNRLFDRLLSLFLDRLLLFDSLLLVFNRGLHSLFLESFLCRHGRLLTFVSILRSILCRGLFNKPVVDRLIDHGIFGHRFLLRRGHGFFLRHSNDVKRQNIVKRKLNGITVYA